MPLCATGSHVSDVQLRAAASPAASGVTASAAPPVLSCSCNLPVPAASVGEGVCNGGVSFGLEKTRQRRRQVCFVRRVHFGSRQGSRGGGVPCREQQARRRRLPVSRGADAPVSNNRTRPSPPLRARLSHWPLNWHTPGAQRGGREDGGCQWQAGGDARNARHARAAGDAALCVASGGMPLAGHHPCSAPQTGSFKAAAQAAGAEGLSRAHLCPVPPRAHSCGCQGAACRRT